MSTDYLQNSASLSKNAKIGIGISVVLLILIIIVGSLAGAGIFNKTTGTSSKSTSTPKSTPSPSPSPKPSPTPVPMTVPPNNGYEPRNEFISSNLFKGVSLNKDTFLNAYNHGEVNELFLVKKDPAKPCPSDPLFVDMGATCKVTKEAMKSNSIFFNSWAPFILYGRKKSTESCPNSSFVAFENADGGLCNLYMDSVK